MRRTYGSEIFSLIDQPQHGATRLRLMAATVHALTLWEPRIRITSQQPVQEPVVQFLVQVDWGQGRLVREYRIALGFAPEGDKARQGDGKTPEGVFKIDRRNDRSQFHLSLGLNYPLPDDRARARAGGWAC